MLRSDTDATHRCKGSRGSVCFARFLTEKGEGVHHIAVATPDYYGTVAEQTRRGIKLPLSGSFGGVDVAYLPTDRDLGVILEVFSGMPGADPEPDASESA